MNNLRRKELKHLADKMSEMNDIQDKSNLQKYYSRLENIKNDEEEYFNNMPENLQGGQRGMDSESAIERMEEAISLIEDALAEDNDDELLDLIAEAVELIEEAAL